MFNSWNIHQMHLLRMLIDYIEDEWDDWGFSKEQSETFYEIKNELTAETKRKMA